MLGNFFLLLVVKSDETDVDHFDDLCYNLKWKLTLETKESDICS